MEGGPNAFRSGQRHDDPMFHDLPGLIVVPSFQHPVEILLEAFQHSLELAQNQVSSTDDQRSASR
jgi:hypothetical protein